MALEFNDRSFKNKLKIYSNQNECLEKHVIGKEFHLISVKKTTTLLHN